MSDWFKAVAFAVILAMGFFGAPLLFVVLSTVLTVAAIVFLIWFLLQIVKDDKQ